MKLEIALVVLKEIKYMRYTFSDDVEVLEVVHPRIEAIKRLKSYNKDGNILLEIESRDIDGNIITEDKTINLYEHLYIMIDDAKKLIDELDDVSVDTDIYEDKKGDTFIELENIVMALGTTGLELITEHGIKEFDDVKAWLINERWLRTYGIGLGNDLVLFGLQRGNIGSIYIIDAKEPKNRILMDKKFRIISLSTLDSEYIMRVCKVVNKIISKLTAELEKQTED